MLKNTSKFVFKQQDRIGDPSAEMDDFLSDCFIDNGNLLILTNCRDSRSIVVGRTGSGKSALLRRIRDVHEHVIEVEPEGLALGYISNSNILSFFADIGVKLDLFYKLLWRHVFVVEILKNHYNLYTEADKIKWFDRVGSILLGRHGRIEAFEYLNQWGTKFWNTTEDRVKETTTVIEKELTSSAGLSAADIITIKAGGKIHLTEQQTREIKKRGEDVVNNIQMSRLSALFDSLDEDILTDPVRRYFITVDRLDEAWVEDHIRYRLIRGLIETIRDFNTKVRHAKIIIALRTDLVEQIYKLTSDSGFQQEKYSALNLNVYWNREDLSRLLDLRVQALVRQRYTKQIVTLKDILPGSIGKQGDNQPMIDYLLDRTLLRPRDAIQFLNFCMIHSIDADSITPQVLVQAEADHSDQRRLALANEWSSRFPHLVKMMNIVRARPYRFKLGVISQEELDAVCLDILTEPKDEQGEDYQIFQRYFSEAINPSELRRYLAQSFYTIGLLGLKLASYHAEVWSERGPIVIPSLDINDDITVCVHKAFWRVLGIRQNPAELIH